MKPRTADDLLAEARATISRLTPEAAYRAQQDGSTIVDTRCADDIAAEGSIPDAVAVPRTVLEWRADRSSRDHDRAVAGARHLIVVCNDGYSSSLAAANLVRLGHVTASDVIGGFRAWKAAGMPVDPPASSAATRRRAR